MELEQPTWTSVVEDDPLPFLIILALFAAGAVVGVLGVVIARRWHTVAAGFGWLALVCAMGCDMAGAVAMTFARSETHSEQLDRGITRDDYEELHRQSKQEARMALMAGATMGVFPFITGVIAILRSRWPPPKRRRRPSGDGEGTRP